MQKTSDKVDISDTYLFSAVKERALFAPASVEGIITIINQKYASENPEFASVGLADMRVWEAYQRDLVRARDFGSRGDNSALEDLSKSEFWSYVSSRKGCDGLFVDGTPAALFIDAFLSDVREEYAVGLASPFVHSVDVYGQMLMSQPVSRPERHFGKWVGIGAAVLATLFGGRLAVNYAFDSIDERVTSRLNEEKALFSSDIEQNYIPRVREELINSLNSAEIQDSIRKTIIASVDEYIAANPTVVNPAVLRRAVLDTLSDPEVRREFERNFKFSLFGVR